MFLTQTKPGNGSLSQHISAVSASPLRFQNLAESVKGSSGQSLDHFRANPHLVVEEQPGHPGWELQYGSRRSFQYEGGTVSLGKEMGSHAELNTGVAATATRKAMVRVISRAWETYLPLCFHFCSVQ